jgi:SAM-dependent methyltransferase
VATYVTKRKIRFSIFDQQLGRPDWAGKRVLDFGGSAGNVLLDPECKIEPGNYWCIEISRDAITEGQRRHPDAHFIFYDRYNYEYNPTGVAGLPIPDPGVRFDIIIASSVVSHNNKTESLALIDQLVALLADDGRLAVTFNDPIWIPPSTWRNAPTSADLSRLDELLIGIQDNRPDVDVDQLNTWAEKTSFKDESPHWSNLHYMLEKQRAVNPEIDIAGLLAQAMETTPKWIALVNSGTYHELVIDPDGDELPEEDPQRPVAHRLLGYLNFCTAEHMSQLLPNAQIRPPVAPDRMHYAIIDGRKGSGRR